MSEKVISAIRKARADFKKTPKGRLADLVVERSRWQRKLTIARNKLEDVNLAISKLALEVLTGEKL